MRGLASGVVELAELVGKVSAARSAGKVVVLTNGVFDVLHIGHLRYLRQARSEGDMLVVGVNADASVRALKPGRPLVPENERAELVAALRPVDHAVIFAEQTANELLRAIRPDVYVKGADYTHASLPEAATAREVGARLVFVALVPNRSSTHLARALSC
ncbi:MAG: adenylyltransferase/cytidyltransferase family protein [Chloroflexota bacterium]